MVESKPKRTAKWVSHAECDCGGHLKFIESTDIAQEMDMWYTGPSTWTRYWECPDCGTIYAEEWRDDKVTSFEEYKCHTAEYIKKRAPRSSGWLC
jgi:hypothetical protein